MYLYDKLPYPYKYFNCFDENYEKQGKDWKKEDFLSKLKNKYQCDEKTLERTKEVIWFLNSENGENLTIFFCKSDVILLADVFEKFIKASIKKCDNYSLLCVSLHGHIWQCGLKNTDIKLQTFQDTELILTLENNIRGGIGPVFGDRYVVSDDNKKIFYVDANILYGWTMSQLLPCDEIEMWYDHPNLYMKTLEEILNTPDD